MILDHSPSRDQKKFKPAKDSLFRHDKDMTLGALTNAQKGLVTQVVPNEKDVSKIGHILIAGRPERLFSASMGDHTTAFSVHAEGIKMHLRGKTYKQAAEWMGVLYRSTHDLPGAKLAKKMNKLSLHYVRLREADARVISLLNDVKKATENSYGELSSLQELISAYLSYRELIPLSAVNVMAKSQGTAGKGHGEAGHVQCLVTYQFDPESRATTDAESLRKAILGTFDPGGVALAILEKNENMLGILAPGLSGENTIKERLQLFVDQHIQSIIALYPDAYNDSGFEPEELEDSIKERLLVAAQKDADFYERRIKSLKKEIKTLKQNAHNPNKLNKRTQNDFDKLTGLKLDYEESLRQLQETGLLDEKIIEEGLDESEDGIDMDDEFDEDDEDDVVEEMPAKKRKTISKEGLSEEEVKELLAQQEEERLLAEERKQPMATQLVIKDGKISELRTAGRTTSPFSGTMGAHTTSWVVHLDRIRIAVEDKTVDQAIDGLVEVFGELQQSHKNLSSHFSFDSENHKTRFNNSDTKVNNSLIKLKSLKGKESFEKTTLIQSCITSILTYANYIPGATIQAVDTGGKSEGKHRDVLRNFNPDVHSPVNVGTAIDGLLDINSLAFSGKWDAINALRKNHNEIIRKTYPKAYAQFEKRPIFSLGSVLKVPAKNRKSTYKPKHK